MRFEYKMREYDADLYNEYQAAAGKIVNGHKSPGAISDIINKKMKLILGDNNKLAYLTHADLILHVRVKSIYADVDTMASIPIEPLPLLCVQAMIIDTIKGLHIRNGGYEDCGKCISFNFSPYWKKANFNHVVDKDLDSNGMPQPCDICYGNNSLQVSKDYIVFLRDKFLDYNGVNSFYTYWPFGGYSSEGGIFQIDESNNVLIPSDYFGYGVSVPLSNFESLLRNDINTIAAH
ncbi:MAG TPA: hypothetical protein VFO76_09860 [Candidatus Kapabacteria bacterium]|nr:hypothetical protein [Candidatus Kapabacteria bacterium]